MELIMIIPTMVFKQPWVYPRSQPWINYGIEAMNDYHNGFTLVL